MPETQSRPPARPLRAVVFGCSGDWSWELRAPNGRLVAYAPGGYTRRDNAVRAVRRMLRSIREQWPEGIEPPLCAEGDG